MLSILINAYACSPGMGSEPGMAWNWCVNLAKYCELHIITEGEFREKIERSLTHINSLYTPFGSPVIEGQKPSLKDEGSDMLVNEYGLTERQIRNLHFYYNPIGGEDEARCAKIRRMCWNQGDWRFYKYYKQWQWRTYLMAKEICANQHIDVLHQLNMIGFREPGYLWKLSKETGVPLVWGPIGGLKQFPITYLQGSGIKMQLFNRLKNFINVFQLRYGKRVNRALNKADLLISSIPDSYRAIKKYHGLESCIIPETGCFESENAEVGKRDFDSQYMRIIWVGKFDFRKRLDIALESIAKVGNEHIRLQIFGTGSGQQVAEAKTLSERLCIDNRLKIEWMGNRPNEEIHEAMTKAHLFFFTSINEDTSTVVMEAISHNLPVLCFNTCGMGYVVNNQVGIKIPLSNPRQSVDDFAEKIEYLYRNRDVLKKLSEGCKERRQELSWDNKARQMVRLYEGVSKERFGK